MSAIKSIKIRMYNTGSVGDCLLLLFQDETGTAFKMLIDCGGWNADTPTISACVADIKSITDGKLDLLVVTHQHEDHISGFNQARALFDQITVDEVWMSWIENETDDIAIILKEKYGKKLKQLKNMAVQAKQQFHKGVNHPLKVRGFKDKMQQKEQSMDDTIQLIEFEEGLHKKRGFAVGKRTNDDAIEYVRKKSKRMRYRLPGEVITTPKAPGIKFHILGPPRDADMRFFKIDMSEDEMYHLAATSKSDTATTIKEDPILTSGIILEEGVSPFGREHHMEAAEMKAFNKIYNSEDLNWRQIEMDWLESAASLALRVSNLTNNTSLAMAIEFEGSKRVALLPADAQSGNWMSWHKPEVIKKLKANGGTETTELLKNTVFYKVGHHGSHNGTASKSGLELIPDKDLVAMMPLVQDKVPTAWGGAKNFPAKSLYKVLINKTKGRLIRTDIGVVNTNQAIKLRNSLTKTQQREFKKSVVPGDCFIEYEIKG